jgi:hypothetical protein
LQKRKEVFYLSAYLNKYINKIRDNRNFTFIDFKSDDETIINPKDGDIFIVEDGVNGFINQDGNLAIYTLDGTYEFITPQVGWECYNSTSGKKYVFNNNTWIDEIISNPINQVDNTTIEIVDGKLQVKDESIDETKIKTGIDLSGEKDVKVETSVNTENITDGINTYNASDIKNIQDNAIDAFKKTIDTTDDIAEGETNLFLTAEEREKISVINVTGDGTKILSDSGEYVANVTLQGNEFNGVSQLVKTDENGKLPAIDGSQLLNLPSGSSDGLIDDWKENVSYIKYQGIVYQGRLYRVLNDIPVATDTPDVDIVNYEYIGGVSSGSTIFLDFTPNYAYSYRDVILRNGILYVAKGNFISTDTFNIVNWDIVCDMKRSVYDINNDGIIDHAELADLATLSNESKSIQNWKPNTFYASGECFVYNNCVYNVNTDFTSDIIFDSTNLTLISTGNHNLLVGLQGGDNVNSKYFHMTENQNTIVGKFKDTTGNLEYSGKVLGDMLKSVYDANDDGVVDKATTLDGLTSTIVELNHLNGVNGNVQAQINALTSVGNFTGSVNTYADIVLNFPNPNQKDMVIVISDETHGNTSTIYLYNGASWEYSGSFTATIRDFSTNPIDINTESTGVLQESRVDVLIARKTDIPSLPNANLLATYTNDNESITNAITNQHIHDNKLLLDSYTQTDNDIADTISKSHIHDNKSIIDNFSENAFGKPLYKGELIGSNGGASSIKVGNATLEGTVELVEGENVALNVNVSNNTITISSTSGAENGLPDGGIKGQIIVKQSGVNGDASWKDNVASNVQLSNEYFTSDNVEDALIELFTYANNIKSSVADVVGSPILATQTVDAMVYNIQTLKNKLANYLVTKFVSANGAETLNSLIEKINSIPQDVTSMVHKTKLNIVAPYTKTFTLSNILSIEDICTSLIKYTEGEANHVEYTIGFDNSDASNFVRNDNIIYDGKMYINNTFDYMFHDMGTLGDGIYHESDEITVDDYNTIDSLIVVVQGEILNLIGTVGTQIVKSLNSYNLSGIDNVTNIAWNTNTSNSGIVLYAISFDTGQTYGAYNMTTDTWDIVDIDNTEDFLLKGMIPSTVNNLTTEQIEEFRNGNTGYMGAYLLSQSSSIDKAENDDLSLIVKLSGTSDFAQPNDYKVSYNSETGDLTYEILTDGTYTFNYVNNE